MKTFIRTASFAVAFFAALFSSDCLAISYTWNGSTGDWGEPGKWTPNGVPGMGDNVTITTGTVTLDAAQSCNNLTLSGGTLTGNNNLAVGGTFTWNEGTTLGGTGTVTVTGATTISGSNVYLSSKTLLLNGGGAWSSGNITTSNGAILRVAAGQTLAITAPGGTNISHNVGAPDTFDNLGTVTVNSSGNINLSIPYFNSGTTQITNGTLRLGGSDTQTGIFNMAANEQLEFSGGTHTLNAPTIIGGTVKITGGTVTLASGMNLPVSTISGGTVNGTGTLTSPANLSVSGASDLSFTGNLNVAGNLSFTGGSIQNTGNVNITGTFTWNDNNLRGTGTVTVTGATSITGSGHQLYNKTLLLNGGGTWSGGDINTSAGAILRVPVGQVLAITAPAGTTMTNAVAPLSIFDNLGTVTVNSSGNINLSIPYFNSGTTQITNGTLRLGGSDTQTGIFNMAANEQLEFSGGTHTLNAPTIIGGTVKITGGTVTLASGMNLPVSTISGGTVNGTGTLTSPANLSVSGASDLSFTGNLNVAGNLSFTGGSIQNTGNVNITGTFTWNDNNLRGTGTVTVTGATSITGSGHQLYNKTLLLNGGGTWSGGDINTSAGAILRVPVGQVLAITAPAGTTMTNAVAPLSIFDNLGTVTVNSSGNLNISVPFNNSGTTQITNGTLRLGGSDTQTGIFNMAANEQLEFSGGTHTLNAPTIIGGTVKITGGTVTLASGMNLPVSTISGGTVNGTGTLTSPANLSVSGASDLSFTGNLNVAGNLSFTGGSIQNTGNVNITGTFTWNDNNLRGTGTVTVTGATSITGSGHQLYNKTLLLNGGGTWSGGDINTSAGAILRVPVGQVLAITAPAGTTMTNAAAPASIFDNLGTVAFNNSGTFNLSIPFTNTGTVKGTGTVNLTSSTVTNSGHFAPGNSPGTLTITGNYTNSILDIEIVAGSPVLFDKLVVSGIATLGGTLNLTETGSVSAGTYTILTAASISGTFATLNLPDCYGVQISGGNVNLIKGVTKIWDGSTGTWSTATSWSPNGVPCIFDDVVINSGVCNLNQEPDASSVTINGGALKKIGAGVTYTLDAPITIGASGILNIFEGTLDINHNFDNNGKVEGFGTIDLLNASIIGDFDIFAPGNSAGTLNIKGTHTNEVMNMEIGGTTGGTVFDVLAMTQNEILGGTINIGYLGGTVPPGEYVIVTCGGGPNCMSGTFAAENFPSQCQGGCSIEITGTTVKLVNTIPIQYSGTCNWLGGAGNWSNQTNWSCNDVPNSDDQVTITAGTVTLDMPATVNTLNLSGGTISGSNNLTVTGTFTWTGGTLNATGTLNVGPVTMSGTMALSNGTLNLNGGGNWNSGSLTLQNNAQLKVGAGSTLNLNVSAPGGISQSGSGTFTNLGNVVKNGTAMFTVGVPYTSTGVTSITQGLLQFQNNFNSSNGMVKGNGTIGLAGVNVLGYGTFSPGSSPGTLTLEGNYENTAFIMEIGESMNVVSHDLLHVGLNVLLDNDLQVVHSGGAVLFGDYTFIDCGGGINCLTGIFETITYPTFCQGNCSIVYTGTTATLHYAIVLPVELVRFEGVLENKAVRLAWETAAEKDHESFTVQRSTNGQAWTELGSIPGHGTTSENHVYQFLDKTPRTGPNYYRLKMVSHDGEVEYSKTITVEVPHSVWHPYPNPVRNHLLVDFPPDTEGRLLLFDWTGRLQLSEAVNSRPTVTLDMSALPAGVYCLRLDGGEGRIVIKK